MLFRTWITCHQFFVRTIIVSSLVIFLATVAFFTWVITGPRSLNLLTPYLQKELNHLSDKFDVKIDKSFIFWDHLQHTIQISVTHFDLLDSEQKPIANFPEVRFKFDWLRFLSGKFISSEVTIHNSTFYVTTNKNQPINEPTENKQTALIIARLLQNYLLADKTNFHIQDINFDNVYVYIDNGETNIGWMIEEGNINLDKNNKTNINHLHAQFMMRLGQLHQSKWIIDAVGKPSQSIDLTLTTQELPSHTFHDLFPEAKWANWAGFLLNGTFRTTMEASSLQFSPIEFNIFKSSGKVQIPQFFNRDIEFNDLNARGTLTPDDMELSLQSLSAKLDKNGPVIQLNGNFQNMLLRDKDDLPESNFDVSIQNLAVNDLQYYWPTTLRIPLRHWITTRITNGTIPILKGEFNITKEDAALLKQHALVGATNPEKLDELPLPSTDMIKATLQLKDANIQYHPKFPVAEKINAVIEFNSKSMNAKISSGKILDTNISNGRVTIDNLWVKPAQLTVESNLEGPATTLTAFLKNSLTADPATNPRLNSLYQMTGDMEGKLSLQLPLQPTLLYDDILLKGNATFSNITLPALIQGHDLSGANLEVNIENRHLLLNGTGSLYGMNIQTEYEEYFSEDKKVPFHLKNRIQSTATTQQLRDLQLIDIPYVEGPFNFDITITQKTDIQAFEGKADLTQSTVLIPDYHLEKPMGDPLALTIKGHKDEKTLDILDLTLQGNEIKIQGNSRFIYTESEPHLVALNFAPFHFKNQNAAIAYELTPDHMMMAIKGKSLDLSKIDLSQIFKSDETPQKRSLDISVDLNRLIMKNHIIFNQVTSHINCGIAQCSRFDLNSHIGNTHYLKANLKPINNQSHLIVESDNAGDLIRALGISKHIEGGKLLIQTTAKRDQGQRLMTEGMVNIYEFKAIKTPLLSKLLTLASFQGLRDLLDQNGISFDRFEAPITYHNGVLTITDAKTSGSSIGITGDGTINTRTDIIDIRGVVVPAQEINKIIGNIPLVGNILTGGKDEGVIATKYRLKGPFNNAKITVNPLSILTPSFLRNIFDIFEQKPEQNSAEKPLQKP